MAQPQTHRPGRYGSALCLLLSAYAGIEGGARPQQVFIAQFVGFPHNLQDCGSSVIALVHELKRALLSLFK